MDGISGSLPRTIDRQSASSKEAEVIKSDHDLIVNRNKSKRATDRQASSYKITKVDTGGRVTDLKSPGNSSVDTHHETAGNQIRARATRQKKLSRTGVKTGTAPVDNSQKVFEKIPTYLKKELEVLKAWKGSQHDKVSLYRKFSSLEKISDSAFQTLASSRNDCRVGKEIILDILERCEELLEAFENKNCPHSIKHYVRLIRMLFEINYIDLCLQTGNKGCKFSFISDFESTDEFIKFLDVLAEKAGTGTNVIPKSRRLQLFCYYQSADAGCENNKRRLVKEMLFCPERGGEDDVLKYNFFYPYEALLILTRLAPGKNTEENPAEFDYDQIIDQLVGVIKNNDLDTRYKLANDLVKDQRYEVKALAPMLFLNKRLGVIDLKGADRFIGLLLAIPDLKVVCSYWKCLCTLRKIEEGVALASANDQSKSSRCNDEAKNNFKAELEFLFNTNCEILFELVFCNNVLGNNLISGGTLIRLYKYINSEDILMSRVMADGMFVCSTFLMRKLDQFGRCDSVITAIEKAKTISVIYCEPNSIAEKLYKESGYFFSIENWRQSNSEDMIRAPKAFLETLGRLCFSKEFVARVFNSAFNAITTGEFHCPKISRPEMGALRLHYWLLVLNFLLENEEGQTGRVNFFLMKTAKNVAFIRHMELFVLRESLAEFLRRLYQYHAFSNYSKEHDLFNPDAISRLALSNKDKQEFLYKLSAIKLFFGDPQQAKACIDKMENVSQYVLPSDYRVLKSGLGKDDRDILKLVIQESHPAGVKYKYTKLISILEGLDDNNNLAFHVDMFDIVLDFVDKSKDFIDWEQKAKLFSGCSGILLSINKVMSMVLEKQCQRISSWHEDLSVTMRGSVEANQFIKVFESFKGFVTELAESSRVGGDHSKSEEYSLDDHLMQRLTRGSTSLVVKTSGRSGEKIQILDCLTENEQLLCRFKSFTEHHLLHQLRTIDSDEEFVGQVKKICGLIAGNSIDNVTLAEIFFLRFKDPKPELYEAITIIAARLNNFVRINLYLEFDMTLKLLKSMRDSLDRHRQRGGIFSGCINIELQYYRLLAQTALKGGLEGGKILARLFEQSENKFFSQVASAIGDDHLSDNDRLQSVANAIEEYDIPHLRCAHLQAAGTEQGTVDDNRGSREWLCKLISENSGFPEIQSEVLWLGYETGKLSVDDYLAQIAIFENNTKEYFFHSVLAAERPDQPVFLTLQNNKYLYLLKRPQLEAIGLKLFEVGRVKDAFWLAENHSAGYLGTMLEWYQDNTKSPGKDSNGILGKLIVAAETGNTCAQCRLVDWVLQQREKAPEAEGLADNNDLAGAEKASETDVVQNRSDYANIREDLIQARCCLYIHLPCIWSDDRRMLYQGIALGTGIGSPYDTEKGLAKIKEALSSDDPVVSFNLYWLQTSSLVGQEFVDNDVLLMAFARGIPDSPGRLLAELIINFGEPAVRQVVAAMNAMAGQSEDKREMLQARCRAIQQWLDQWCEQVRLEKMSPVEKLIHHFAEEDGKGWPVENFSSLKDQFTVLSESYRNSDLFQTALIFYVKKLSQLSHAHKDFSVFLCKFVVARNHYKLLIYEKGAKKLDWNDQYFNGDNKLALFRAMPESERRKILQGLVAQIINREKLPASKNEESDNSNKRDKRKVDQSCFPGVLVKEFEEEIKRGRQEDTKAKVAKCIETISAGNSKEYSYYKLLQFFCFAENAGVNKQDRKKYGDAIKKKATTSLKNKIDFVNEREVLSKVVICILA